MQLTHHISSALHRPTKFGKTPQNNVQQAYRDVRWRIVHKPHKIQKATDTKQVRHSILRRIGRAMLGTVFAADPGWEASDAALSIPIVWEKDVASVLQNSLLDSSSERRYIAQ